MSEELERVWLVMEAIALAQPELSMRDGVLLAQSVHKEVVWLREHGISNPPVKPPHPTTAWHNPEDRAKWLGAHAPLVCNEIRAGETFRAIKETRILTKCGLAAAKDAVEYLQAHPELMVDPPPPF